MEIIRLSSGGRLQLAIHKTRVPYLKGRQCQLTLMLSDGELVESEKFMQLRE